MAITAPIRERGSTYFLTPLSFFIKAINEISAIGYMKILWNQHNLHGTKAAISEKDRLPAVANALTIKMPVIEFSETIRAYFLTVLFFGIIFSATKRTTRTTKSIFPKRVRMEKMSTMVLESCINYGCKGRFSGIEVGSSEDSVG